MKQKVKREERKLQIYTDVNVRRGGRRVAVFSFAGFGNAQILAVLIFAQIAQGCPSRLVKRSRSSRCKYIFFFYMQSAFSGFSKHLLSNCCKSHDKFD